MRVWCVDIPKWLIRAIYICTVYLDIEKSIVKDETDSVIETLNSGVNAIDVDVPGVCNNNIDSLRPRQKWPPFYRRHFQMHFL